MKIISLQKNLKNSLYAVSHIAQKNSTLPILNSILISARNGVINLIATNLEIGITSVLRGKIESEGAFTVDAKTLSEYVSLLDNDKVELSVLENNLLVQCSAYKTKIKGTSVEEFPLIPVIDKDDRVAIPALELKQALSQIIFSVSVDENRAELSGVLFSFTNKNLTIVGTDSYRLAEKRIAVDGDFSDRQIIIPAKTLQELVRIISSDQEDEDTSASVVLYATENQCLFIVGGTELVSRLIDGRYPDYQQIIPAKHRSRALVARDELIRSVKAASIFSKTGVNDVVFSLEKNNLSISSASGQSGEHNSKILANTSGDDVSITLNYRYVLDGLLVMSSNEVTIEIVDDQTPCIFKDTKDEVYTYLVMPIKK